MVEGKSTRCDLLFMDINLTDGLSFEIFNQIESNTNCVCNSL